MTHKFAVELRTGETYRDGAFHEGRTPDVGEKLVLKAAPDKIIHCRVQAVLYGAIPHSAMTFEAVDDVRAREE